VSEGEDSEIRWATTEDARLAMRDQALYGTVFVMRNEDGTVRRIDPDTVEPACSTCDGSGTVGHRSMQIFPPMRFPDDRAIPIKCPDCDGSGRR
jgi:hypothetical protein